MKPYYSENGITIYHGDCREVLPSLGRFDLLRLVDLVSGVEQITQLDPNSENMLVEVKFGTGKVAITRTTQADIDAAVKMLDEQRRDGGGR